MICCEWCNKNHNTRNCPYEKICSKEISLEVGKLMEEYVEKNLCCPKCKNKSLKRLNNYSPSLDLNCIVCNKNIEVKSKCLSIKNLPNDIQCKSGKYEYFIKNIKENDLDLILIIYKVSRKTKKITIREIYWLDNETLKNNEKVNIIKNNNNDLSVINIENTNVLKKLLVPSNNFILIQNYVNGLQKKIDNIFKYQLI